MYLILKSWDCWCCCCRWWCWWWRRWWWWCCCCCCCCCWWWWWGVGGGGGGWWWGGGWAGWGGWGGGGGWLQRHEDMQIKSMMMVTMIMMMQSSIIVSQCQRHRPYYILLLTVSMYAYYAYYACTEMELKIKWVNKQIISNVYIKVRYSNTFYIHFFSWKQTCIYIANLSDSIFIGMKIWPVYFQFTKHDSSAGCVLAYIECIWNMYAAEECVLYHCGFNIRIPIIINNATSRLIPNQCVWPSVPGYDILIHKNWLTAFNIDLASHWLNSSGKVHVLILSM